MKTSSLEKGNSYWKKLMKLLKRKACRWLLLTKISNGLIDYRYRQRQKEFNFAHVKFYERACKTESQGIKWLIWTRETFGLVTCLVLILWNFIEADIWVILYKIDLFKVFLRIVSFVDLFIFIAFYIVILDSLIATWRQASTEKILITVLKEISLSDRLN